MSNSMPIPTAISPAIVVIFSLHVDGRDSTLLIEVLDTGTIRDTFIGYTSDRGIISKFNVLSQLKP